MQGEQTKIKCNRNGWWGFVLIGIGIILLSFSGGAIMDPRGNISVIGYCIMVSIMTGIAWIMIISFINNERGCNEQGWFEKISEDFENLFEKLFRPEQEKAAPKLKNYKYIIKGSAIVLGVLVFTLPLVQYSSDKSLNATGHEIAVGAGDLFYSGDNDYPLAFILLISPILLLVLPANKSFTALRNVSIIGLAAKIIFMVIANNELSGAFAGAYELTYFNLLVAAIYMGVCVFTFYCDKEEKRVKSTSSSSALAKAE